MCPLDLRHTFYSFAEYHPNCPSSTQKQAKQVRFFRQSNAIKNCREKTRYSDWIYREKFCSDWGRDLFVMNEELSLHSSSFQSTVLFEKTEHVRLVWASAVEWTVMLTVESRASAEDFSAFLVCAATLRESERRAALRALPVSLALSRDVRSRIRTPLPTWRRQKGESSANCGASGCGEQMNGVII